MDKKKISPTFNFERIITNPKPEKKCPVSKIRKYLGSVLKGDGKKPYCPYVKMIEKRNGYYHTGTALPPDKINLKEIGQHMKNEFHILSPFKTNSEQNVDPINIIYSFSHQDTLQQKFLDSMLQYRENNRQDFLDQGLMIAYMHLLHALGGSTNNKIDTGNVGVYNSGIPLLIVRRMHKADYVFMHKEDEINAYEEYFGDFPYKNIIPSHINNQK